MFFLGEVRILFRMKMHPLHKFPSARGHALLLEQNPNSLQHVLSRMKFGFSLGGRYISGENPKYIRGRDASSSRKNPGFLRHEDKNGFPF